MAGMTPDQKAKFQELLGKGESGPAPMLWDELPINIKRILIYAAGMPQHCIFNPWSSFSAESKQQISDAAKEFVVWADAVRSKMAKQPEGAAA